MSEEHPTIRLERERVLCIRHGEPFREQWPKGFPIMSLRLFEHTWGMKGDEKLHEKLIAEARRLVPIAEDAKVGLDGMHAVMDAKPLCCRIEPALLEKLYVESGIGVIERCLNCRQRKLGTPFCTSKHGRLRHICFNCVVFKMRPDPGIN